MRYLMIVGAAILLLFGVAGIALSLDERRDVHPGTIEGLDVDSFSTKPGRAGVELEQVEIRDHVTGDLESVDNADLYRAVGEDGVGESAELEIQASDGSVTRVRFRGEWYGTGASVAGLIFGAVFAVAGLLLLWLGIRRFRRR